MISGRAALLAIAGIVGVLLSVGLTISLFLRYFPLGTLLAIIVYLAGALALAILSSGRQNAGDSWPLWLLLPLPAGLLIWWGLGF